MKTLEYFPASYHDARTRFLEGTRDLQAPVERGSWPVPSASDKELFVDHVYLPCLAEPRMLMVILSGVHGPEGYTGSAIQSMFVKEILPHIDRREIGILLVHAMNPYGFKNHLRCTEAGVNINRNCSSGPKLYQRRNSRSVELSRQFIPAEPVSSRQSRLLSGLRREGKGVWFDDVSMDALTKGVGTGQFEDARGLEFGGFAPEPQVRALVDKLSELIPKYRDIVALDLHTGLGDSGRLHLLTGWLDKAVDESLKSELFDIEADRDAYTFTPSNAEGFYEVHGATNDLFGELVRDGQRACALTMEFGTAGHSLEAQIEGLNGWVLEHQGQHYGYANAELETAIRADYLERFFPRSPEWREKVMVAARETLQRVLTRAGVARF